MLHPSGGIESNPTAAESTGSVFHVHKVSKVYRVGEVEVHALREVTLDLYQGEFAVLLATEVSEKTRSRVRHASGGVVVPSSSPHCVAATG